MRIGLSNPRRVDTEATNGRYIGNSFFFMYRPRMAVGCILRLHNYLPIFFFPFKRGLERIGFFFQNLFSYFFCFSLVSFFRFVLILLYASLSFCLFVVLFLSPSTSPFPSLPRKGKQEFIRKKYDSKGREKEKRKEVNKNKQKRRIKEEENKR